VGKYEPLKNIQSFQRDKNLGPNDLLLELFMGCYEFIEDDLRVVQATEPLEKCQDPSTLVL
jgi:hypothetical protein